MSVGVMTLKLYHVDLVLLLYLGQPPAPLLVVGGGRERSTPERVGPTPFSLTRVAGLPR